MKRGHYITIEGGEGCGKTTQAKLLFEYLTNKKIKCSLCREPGGVESAEEIRKIVLNKDYSLSNITELFLFEASRAEFFSNKVIPSVNEGTTIITDRSGYSTEAYQGYGGRISLELIKNLNALATFGLKPDLAFIIDINPMVGLEKQVVKDRFADKGLDYHKKVNEGYLKIAKQEPERFVVIPYENGISKIQEQIIKNVEEKLFKK